MTGRTSRLCTRCLTTVAAWVARWPAPTHRIPARVRGPFGAWHLRTRMLEQLEHREMLSGLATDGVLRLATGYGLLTAVSQDFNGDGWADIASLNSSVESTVSILMNTGDGAFATRVQYSLGSSSTVGTPTCMIVGDFNQDGHPDLAVGDSGVSSLGAGLIHFVMNNGDGTFATPLGYLKHTDPILAMTTGDFDGNGTLDLVVANENRNAVTIYMNQGMPPNWQRSEIATASAPAVVIAADFDNDGRADIAVPDSLHYNVSVFLSRGDGTFTGRTDYGTGYYSSSLTAADLNGDGKQDMAAASASSDNVSVLLNKGDGTFGLPVISSNVGTALASIATADFNGDGKVDLALTDFIPSNSNATNTLHVLFNGGGGTFASRANYTVKAALRSVAVADFNHDGKYDLAVADGDYGAAGYVWVLPNTGNGAFTPQISYAVGTGPTAVIMSDLNNDGKLDLVVANGSANTISVLRGNGNGTFASAASYAVGTSPRAVVAADLNGDGKIDLAVANSGSNNVSVLLNTGSGAFGAKTDYAVGASPRTLAASDLNADGKPDLAVGNSGAFTFSVLLNAANGTFAPKVDYDLPGYPYAVVSADFDGDGKMDLATADYNYKKVSILLNNGAGFASPVNYSLGAAWAYALAVADFNGDGRPDLAVSDRSSFLYILLNSGTGGFLPVTSYNNFNIFDSLVPTDFDGDGVMDLVTGSATSNTNTLWHNAGNGSFVRQADLLFAPGPTSLASGDINADGASDLAGVASTGNTVNLSLTRQPSLQANIHGPYTVSQGNSVTLTGTGTAKTSTITQWAWDFNYDGSFQTDATGTNPVFSAVAKAPGSYTLALQITDNLGATSIQTTTVTVRGPAFHGTAGNDTFRLHLNTTTNLVEFYENTPVGGAPTFSIPQSLAGTISVFGGFGADQITIDSGAFVAQTDWGSTCRDLTVHVATDARLTLNATTHLSALALDDTSTVTLGNGPGHVLVTTGLTIASAARLDLAQNDLLVHKSTPAALLALLADGRLLSSAANASSDLRCVVVLNGAYFAYPKKFDGEYPLATDALARFTYRGDATLDGTLDFNDFLATDTGYLFGGSSWTQGDFDSSGSVTSADYHILNQTYLALQPVPAPVTPAAPAPATAATAEDSLTSTPAPAPAPASTTPPTSAPASASTSQPLPISAAVSPASGPLSLTLPGRFLWTTTTEEDPLTLRRPPTWRITLATTLSLPSSTPAPRPSNIP